MQINIIHTRIFNFVNLYFMNLQYLFFLSINVWTFFYAAPQCYAFNFTVYTMRQSYFFDSRIWITTWTILNYTFLKPINCTISSYTWNIYMDRKKYYIDKYIAGDEQTSQHAVNKSCIRNMYTVEQKKLSWQYASNWIFIKL